ncbi:MAG: family N-acetyltransferase [Chitinophagaceae bacterium]|nr:family N-acetyltransferase [Chitinophagaceae bacterium]
MEIQRKQHENHGKFFIEIDGKEVAEMVYRIEDDNVMAIDHTEVGPELKGKGAGLLLVKAGVEYAREHHMKIIPYCSFAKAMFDKKPELRDVLMRDEQ